MAAHNDTASMALFCDFENVALGVRDAQYEKFDIRPVLERLLAKGSIVVKKAYCDWDRYKAFKAAMHEANFELIEIPHVRQSGKNSADIRMVVDALDLCYTKSHVDTFVIISGDSDFSPLVSKLRENAKKVIGVGVKQSCSDLLVTNCDEFIYYDDLVRDREAHRNSSQRREREKRSPEEEVKRREKQEERRAKALDIVHATFVDLIADRGESERIWASVLKEVIKRRNPGFNESYYGFRTFGNLLEDAAARGLLGFGRDDKGAFVFRAPARPGSGDAEPQQGGSELDNGEAAGLAVDFLPAPETADATVAAAAEAHAAKPKAAGRRRNSRRGQRAEEGVAAETASAENSEPLTVIVSAPVAPPMVAPLAPPAAEVPEAVAVAVPAAAAETPAAEEPRRRGGRRPAKKKDAAAAPAVVEPAAVEAAPAIAEAPLEAPAGEAKAKPARNRRPKAAADSKEQPATRRPARSRKPKAATED